MSHKTTTGLLMVLLTPFTSTAGQRMLQGTVKYEKEYDETLPAPDVEVAIQETGDVTKTTDTGKFRVLLKDSFGAG